jgi:Na+/H+-dicarboxylate symporter
MSFVRSYTKPAVFGTIVIIALALGALLGVIARQTGARTLLAFLSTIGSLFTNLLQLTVLPLVFTAIVIGISSLHKLGGPRTAARLGGKTLLWFAATSLIAVLIGIIIGVLGQPGRGVVVTPDPANVQKVATKDHGSWLTLVHIVVPDNVVAAFSKGEVLQVVFLALLVGLASYHLKERAEPFVAINRAVFDITQRVLGWIILFAPIGVLGMIGTAFASYGNQFVLPLISLIVTVYLGALVVLFVVYPLLLRFVGKISPVIFFSKAWAALQFAFVSRSSAATLPLSRQTAIDLGVAPDYAGFAISLGTTTKMDGCAAVYPAIATIFIANLSGIVLGLWQYVAITMIAVFGALATAGTTGWFTMLTLTLSTVNFPPQVIATGLAIVIGIDPIMDMIRTTTNVAGQITVPILVARSEGLLDDQVAQSVSRLPLPHDEQGLPNPVHHGPIPAGGSE